MDNKSFLEKILPIVDNLTLTQLKIDQLKQKTSQYSEQWSSLRRLYSEQSELLAKTAISERMPSVAEIVFENKINK